VQLITVGSENGWEELPCRFSCLPPLDLQWGETSEQVHRRFGLGGEISVQFLREKYCIFFPTMPDLTRQQLQGFPCPKGRKRSAIVERRKKGRGE